ncbi:uncharacterized protein HKW66_Vig0247380 [Vigna angularis]|uniref:Uncharacterized protein n=1 Tax=Phaseolus angularis TaxID=3914 RepID=A0A8T0KV26_PHAAN|nr:uncharacterized protein HKW66_Vig0247380 [Vigna angularis]
MGAVCSTGMVERNAELGGKSFGFSGMLIKENSFVNRGDAISDSRSNSGQGRKQKRHDSGFYKEELFRDFTIWAKGKVLSAKMMARDKGGVAPSRWLEDERSCEEVFRNKGDEVRSFV